MTINFRTSGAWGPGLGRNLTAAEVDGNFYDLDTRVDDLETNPPTPNDISGVSVSGSQLSFTLVDGTVLGPVSMPILTWAWRGEWAPTTIYEALDTFVVTGVGLFMVLVDHTSAATFDPDATGGSPPADLYYQLIGAGSLTTLGELSDVSLTGLAADDFLAYNGTDWTNRTPSAVTALLMNFSGDAGAGGAKGLVPAPAAGDAAADKFLKADGNWAALAIGDVSGLAAGIAAFLGTPSSANFKTALTDDTLDGFTLSGTTTLPGSGQITSSGELSLGAAASALFTLGGTYTTANSAVFKMNTTLVSPVTSTQQAFNFSPVFNPSGASLGTLYGASLFDSTISGSSSLNITAYNGIASRLNEGSGYSGTVSFGRAFQALDPILNGANPITVYYHYNGNAITNGNNLASGTVTNHGFNFDGITAGSAGGTVNNYMGKITVPSGGSSSGTTNNRGLYITGNGGTASGSPPGTVNNFAIFSDSTALSHLAGGLRVGTTTLLTSSVALGNGAAAGSGTLTNAPAAGNPTKWIPINDNGTTRYLPAW